MTIRERAQFCHTLLQGRDDRFKDETTATAIKYVSSRAGFAVAIIAVAQGIGGNLNTNLRQRARAETRSGAGAIS
jgi:Flp pilus assembly pilin Flp